MAPLFLLIIGDKPSDRIVSLNSVLLIFVMVKCSFVFEVRTEFLNVI
jgi:hypothetical protein